MRWECLGPGLKQRQNSGSAAEVEPTGFATILGPGFKRTDSKKSQSFQTTYGRKRNDVRKHSEYVSQ